MRRKPHAGADWGVLMTSIRCCSLALALSLGLAAPAAAGWWPSGEAGAAATKPAPVSAPVKRTGTAVPEPADFALFAAGVIGLLLGRRGSRSRRD
jgi:hypothetical protein